MAFIAKSFRQLRAVVLAQVSSTGILLDANDGFFRLLPAGTERSTSVLPYFLTPSFAQLSGSIHPGASPCYEGLLTVGDQRGRPRSLRGAVYCRQGTLLLIAEHDIEELERISEVAIQLSNDLARLERDLLSANHQLRLREAEILQLSLTDQLTGIANRRKLHETLQAEVARAQRYGSNLALAMADIDHFKRVNDEYGHDAGDKVLQAFGKILGSHVREADLVARYGGEEFVIVMPQTGDREAVACAERVREALGSMVVPPLARPVTASFGTAQLHADETGEGLLKRADQALYCAKQAGRNRVWSSERLEDAPSPTPA